MPDRAHLLATGRVYRHSGLQHLVSDRQALIHQIRAHVAPMTRVGVVGHVEWVDFLPVPAIPAPGRGDPCRGRPAARRRRWRRGRLGAGRARRRRRLLLRARGRRRPAARRWRSSRSAASGCTSRGARSPPVAPMTLLEPTGERTIITLGERLEPRGSDELDWGLLGDVRSRCTSRPATPARSRAPAGRPSSWPLRGRESVLETGTSTRSCSASSDPDEREWAAARGGARPAARGDRGRARRAVVGRVGGRWAAAPLPGPARDSYGCGDSFAAAFTLGLGRGGSVD